MSTPKFPATPAEVEAAIAARLLHSKLQTVSYERKEGPDGPIIQAANRVLRACTGLCGKSSFEAWQT